MSEMPLPRILVVDDEPAMRTVIRRVLSQRCHIVDFGDAREALSALAADPSGFSLLLTDVVMAPVDGCILGRLAREIAPHLPVLYMSGYMPSQLSRYGVIDERAFVAKPFSASTLRDAIDHAIAEQRQPTHA